MGVDEKRVAEFGVGLVAGQVKFSHGLAGYGVKIVQRIEAEIMGTDVNIVDVDEEAAPGTLDRFGQKTGFGNLVAHREIARRVFDKDLPTQRLLHLVNMIAEAVERIACHWHRQEIVEILSGMNGPSEMFGDQRRLEAPDKCFPSSQVIAVERPGAAERQADTVK
jgi:hypothetical protein